MVIGLLAQALVAASTAACAAALSACSLPLTPFAPRRCPHPAPPHRHSTFVVGYDTAIRLVMPKYYNNSETEMAVEFDRLRQLGCSFLVAGRLEGGRFLDMEHVSVPPPLQGLFAGIPEAAFRVDISSTELRQRSQAAARQAPQ